MRYNNAFERVNLLCDCYTGQDKVECSQEAENLTKAFFQVWTENACNEQSFGYLKGAPFKDDPSRTRKSMNCYNDDIHSGWYCYHWAYLVHSKLFGKYKYFNVQRSGYMQDDGNRLLHNWVTIFTCNPSTERSTSGALHLDPWIINAVGILNNEEHTERLGALIIGGQNPPPLERNLICTDLVDKTDLRGTYIDEYGKKILKEKKDMFRW